MDRSRLRLAARLVASENGRRSPPHWKEPPMTAARIAACLLVVTAGSALAQKQVPRQDVAARSQSAEEELRDALWSFRDPARSRAKLLARFEALAERFPTGECADEIRAYARQLRQMVAED